MNSIDTKPYCLDYVFLHMDGNGTTVIGDTTKKMNTLISEVAGFIVGKWDEKHPEMTYKEFIQKILIPGNKYDKGIKQLQEKKIENFLEVLKESHHPLYEKAITLYTQLAEKYLDPHTGLVKFCIFPSIINLIKKVKAICNCSLNIRTFGLDGRVIAEEFRNCGIDMKRQAKMIGGGIQIEGENEIKTGAVLLKTLQEENTIIQDQINEWFANERKAASGKVIPCVEDAQWNGQTVLTIFLDDNLNKRPKSTAQQQPADPNEQNIAWPQDISGKPTSWDSKGVIGIRINPVKAALQENYVVNKVNKQLIKRGFTPLK